MEIRSYENISDNIMKLFCFNEELIEALIFKLFTVKSSAPGKPAPKQFRVLLQRHLVTE